MVAFNAFALALAMAGAGQAPGGGETALLDFTADSCGPCRSMRPVVRRLQAEGYPVREIDLGQQPALAKRYRVTSIPCFVLVIDGREVDRAVGVTDYGRLANMAGRARERLASGPPAGPVPNATPMVVPVTGTAGGLAPRSPSPPDGGAAGAGLQTGGQVLLRSTVRIRVDDGTGRSYGTGTIIDARDGAALVLTCGHLFREARDDGKIFVDLFLSGAAKTVPAHFISYDLTRDLGLLSIRPGVPVPVARVAPKGQVISRGDPVTNVGCDNGQDPTVRQTHVTHIDRYAGPPNIEAAGTPVEGRSGGGLFDQQGHVIGVCFAADSIDNEGLYAGLASIHAELDRLGFTDVYAAEPSLAADSPDALAQAAPPPLPMPRQMPAVPAVQRAPVGQAAVQPRTPVAVQNTNLDSSQDAPVQLSRSEQAALSEIRTRSRGTEVICIVRPADPSAKSEIFVLQNVSPEFIKQLTQNGRQRPAPHLTSMALPPRAPAACRQDSSRQEVSDSVGWQSKRRLAPVSRPR